MWKRALVYRRHPQHTSKESLIPARQETENKQQKSLPDYISRAKNVEGNLENVPHPIRIQKSQKEKDRVPPNLKQAQTKVRGT